MANPATGLTPRELIERRGRRAAVAHYTDREEPIYAEGIWLVEHTEGCKSYKQILKLEELPKKEDLHPFVEFMMNEEELCRIISGFFRQRERVAYSYADLSRHICREMSEYFKRQFPDAAAAPIRKFRAKD